MSEPTRRRKRRPRIATAILLAAIAFLVAAYAFVSADHSSLRDQLVEARAETDRLQTIADQIKSRAEQLGENLRIAQDVLRICRTPEDLPDLGGERIISIMYSDSHFGLNFYVPDGKHTLEIISRWRPAVDKSAVKPDEIEQWTGAKTWRVPLAPASGYILKLDDDRRDDSRPAKWYLTGNSRDFESQSAVLPLVDFKPRGWSWSSHRTFAFPNQVPDRYVRHRLPNNPPGVTIMDVTLRGPHGEEQYEVHFSVRVCSEGPLTVPASAALGYFYQGKHHELSPYRGNGRYDVREVTP